MSAQLIWVLLACWCLPTYPSEPEYHGNIHPASSSLEEGVFGSLRHLLQDRGSMLQSDRFQLAMELKAAKFRAKLALELHASQPNSTPGPEPEPLEVGRITASGRGIVISAGGRDW